MKSSVSEALSLFDAMCGSRKYPYSPHGRSLDIPSGEGGVFKAKLLEEKYEAKLEFPGGWGGAKWKTFCGGEYGYFLELHNVEQ